MAVFDRSVYSREGSSFVTICTELRTPERSSGDEENEDTAQLLKDIKRVREELQLEEATIKTCPESASAKSPLALSAHAGKNGTQSLLALPAVARWMV